MKDILIDIDKLVSEELERANKEYPIFASDHEGYAVIQEEIDEVITENDTAMNAKTRLWRAIKNNDSNGAKAAARRMRECMSYATAEMIQVIAMCEKFVQSQEERKE